MEKCSNHLPDFKLLVFTENPTRKGIYDLSTSATFNKFRYFRLEKPKQPYLIQQGAEFVCESWDNGVKTLHTGLIPAGAPGYYFGDHSETIQGAKKTSLMIFRFIPDTSIIQIYFFNHYNKRSIPMKLEFCRNLIKPHKT
jgi:hypothetical protein